jgi:hypothetical protein
MNSAVIIEEKPGTGTLVMNGRLYWTDGRGGFIPDANVRPQDKLTDEYVRKIIAFARPLSDQVSRFKAHTMADIAQLDGMHEQNYGYVRRGNKGKGNRTYQTYDGLMQVIVQVADEITFGPELQVAKGLVDECLTEWAADSRDEIQAIILKAFDTDKEGNISRTRICSLLKLDISDPRWRRAMDAVRDAQRVVGRKEYVRFETRAKVEDAFTPLTISMAKA